MRAKALPERVEAPAGLAFRLSLPYSGGTGVDPARRACPTSARASARRRLYRASRRAEAFGYGMRSPPARATADYVLKDHQTLRCLYPLSYEGERLPYPHAAPSFSLTCSENSNGHLRTPDLHSFPTRRSSDWLDQPRSPRNMAMITETPAPQGLPCAQGGLQC